ncbi:hypothetical protein IFM46972_09301 [Aspergillus udagawae]|uniref:Uncharacterized protein n=1 Tax=Aspergillus udagawae TaxID=91492 RepID=A0A8H3PEP7_9EURO|nr:hypothetical protein IFM46972_09301 [Aspergillus udagawae]
MAVLGLLLGAAGTRTGRNYTSAAIKRREIDAADIAKLGDVFQARRRCVSEADHCQPVLALAVDASRLQVYILGNHA